MKRILLGIAVIAVLAAGVAFAVVYVNQQNRIAEEKEKREAEQAEKDQRNAERNAKAQAANAPSSATPASVAGYDNLTDMEKCQLEKAVDDLEEDGALQLVQEWTLDRLTVDDPDIATLPELVEQVGQGPSFSEFLATKGYNC